MVARVSEFKLRRSVEAEDYCDDWRLASLGSVILTVTLRPTKVEIFAKSNFLATHQLYQRLANVVG